MTHAPDETTLLPEDLLRWMEALAEGYDPTWRSAMTVHGHYRATLEFFAALRNRRTPTPPPDDRAEVAFTEALSKEWEAKCFEPGTIQVHPLNDTMEHELYGETCACAPRVEIVEGRRVVVHDAQDGRE